MKQKMVLHKRHSQKYHHDYSAIWKRVTMQEVVIEIRIIDITQHQGVNRDLRVVVE